MEFIGKKYILKTPSEFSLSVEIKKELEDFFAVVKFNHPKDGTKIEFTSPVNIESDSYFQYVEIPSICVNESLNQDGNIPANWIINTRIVDEFRLKCQFIGCTLSSVSTIEILHLGNNKWNSYPLELLGKIECITVENVIENSRSYIQ